jgi:predicted lipid-binding transport protein (Tim44 family)
MTTPEMLSYFSRDVADYKRKGVRNEVRDVRLLQGDWRRLGESPRKATAGPIRGRLHASWPAAARTTPPAERG